MNNCIKSKRLMPKSFWWSAHSGGANWYKYEIERYPTADVQIIKLAMELELGIKVARQDKSWRYIFLSI